MADKACVVITSEVDIITARHEGRTMAAEIGFSSVDQTLVATAISELARNIIVYARRGEIILKVVHQNRERGMVIIARDEGPGIPDIDLAMQDGFSTSKSLGLGLPGVRRLMDEFEITSQAGKGTTVTARKWKRTR